MDTPTIELPKAKAREQLREYRAAVKDDIAKRRSKLRAEDEAIAAGLRELARGNNLLELQGAFEAAGLDDAGLPRIAIARADGRWCFLDWSSRWDASDTRMIDWFRFRTDDRWSDRADRSFTWLGVPPIATPIDDPGFRTQVPIVPPALRPRGELSRYHILFEVKEWARLPVPPHDPLLLRRVRGDLFAILATWELTDLERTVMGTRR
jgi:hypothetical protein